jgi:hypothetical protein
VVVNTLTKKLKQLEGKINKFIFIQPKNKIVFLLNMAIYT